jgi:phosphoribosylformylglycinamidine synthase
MRLYKTLHAAIKEKNVVSCHDLSEGGLAVALSEMAFAGECGVDVDLSSLREACFVSPEVALFSESNSRLLCEVPASMANAFEKAFQGLPCYRIGTVVQSEKVRVTCQGVELINADWSSLRQSWLSPLDWK